jgi:hypothetical protein
MESKQHGGAGEIFCQPAPTQFETNSNTGSPQSDSLICYFIFTGTIQISI